MDTSDQKARDILEKLASQLAMGWKALLVSKRIHEARASKRINCAYHFFGITEESCIESAFLALSRVIIHHKDSVDIQYLLKYAGDNHKVFSRADKQTIIDSITRHRQQLDNISLLVANIKEQRDTTVAHTDKKHVTNPLAVYTHPPLNYEEVENTFVLLLRILKTYSRYLNPYPPEQIPLDKVDSEITKDLNYLVGLIEQDNEKDA